MATTAAGPGVGGGTAPPPQGARRTAGQGSLPQPARYGPTPIYGECEAEPCARTARTTCGTCGGQFCRTHCEHDSHAETG